MKISYNWLKNYIDLDPVEHSPECLQEVLPLLGFDIEEIEKLGPPQLDKVVVGQVIEYGPTSRRRPLEMLQSQHRQRRRSP
jgi:hypothetical protein